jgi:hypothetical protein
MKKTEGRVRRDREQWSALVAEWRASGVQGREFARLKGLSASSLYYWSSVVGRQLEHRQVSWFQSEARTSLKLIALYIDLRTLRETGLDVAVLDNDGDGAAARNCRGARCAEAAITLTPGRAGAGQREGGGRLYSLSPRQRASAMRTAGHVSKRGRSAEVSLAFPVRSAPASMTRLTAAIRAAAAPTALASAWAVHSAGASRASPVKLAAV